MNINNRDRKVDEIENKNHVFDLKNAIIHTRWFLTFLGIWPYVISKPSRTEKYISKFLLPFCSISMIVLVIPILTYVILQDVDRLDLLILLGPISFQTTNIVKHFVLVFRSGSIKLCIEHMENDWRNIVSQNDRDIMIRNLRVGHGLTMMCTICMYSGAISYHTIMPLWSGNTINEMNETVRPLAYPGTDLFVDLRSGFNYEIVFCSNCLSAFFHFTVVTAICNIAAIFVSHACGQIQIVISRLENLVDDDNGIDDDKNDVEERIAFIIRCHVRVLRFSAIIDEVLQEICLMEVGASTLIICMLEYYCMTEWSNSESVAIVTYVVLLISECFNIYIFCHIGELLKEQFAEVGKASYLIDWYKLPGRTGLAIILIIAMANYPRKLTAGGMMELSIESFSNIMKTSVGYLNMVRTIAT
nr:olfactory receptor 12 [Gregopimpla kuwanae]